VLWNGGFEQNAPKREQIALGPAGQKAGTPINLGASLKARELRKGLNPAILFRRSTPEQKTK
jgi:hypothetical protein